MNLTDAEKGQRGWGKPTRCSFGIGRYHHIASWKFIDRDTGQPTLQVGFYSWQKVKEKKKKPSHASPYWVEFGTNPHAIKPKNAKIMWYKDYFGVLVNHPGQRPTHLLRDTIQNNIDEIRAAQEKYLKQISEVMDIADIKIKETPDEEND